MKRENRWPKAIFYDSKNTLFAWDRVWIKTSSNILKKYENHMAPEEFWRQRAKFLGAENLKTAFGKYRKFTESLRVSLIYAFKYFAIAGCSDNENACDRECYESY